MINQVQRGDAIYLPAPSGGCKSGDLVVIGVYFGIAATDGAAGDIVAFYNKGVYTLAKKSADVFTMGAVLYWDSVNKWLTLNTNTNTTKVGVATVPVPYTAATMPGNGAVVADVLLNQSRG